MHSTILLWGRRKQIQFLSWCQTCSSDLSPANWWKPSLPSTPFSLCQKNVWLPESHKVTKQEACVKFQRRSTISSPDSPSVPHILLLLKSVGYFHRPSFCKVKLLAHGIQQLQSAIHGGTSLTPPAWTKIALTHAPKSKRDLDSICHSNYWLHNYEVVNTGSQMVLTPKFCHKYPSALVQGGFPLASIVLGLSEISSL